MKVLLPGRRTGMGEHLSPAPLHTRRIARISLRARRSIRYGTA